jgi:hypothetical protein
MMVTNGSKGGVSAEYPVFANTPFFALFPIIGAGVEDFFGYAFADPFG